MVMFPEASHPAMVSLAASSALQLMMVSEESKRIVRAGKHVHGIAGTGLVFQRLVADACQRTGRRHYAHGHTGIHGARAVCDLHGMDAVVPGSASLVAETCKLPERDRFW